MTRPPLSRSGGRHCHHWHAGSAVRAQAALFARRQRGSTMPGAAPPLRRRRTTSPSPSPAPPRGRADAAPTPDEFVRSAASSPQRCAAPSCHFPSANVAKPTPCRCCPRRRPGRFARSWTSARVMVTRGRWSRQRRTSSRTPSCAAGSSRECLPSC